MIKDITIYTITPDKGDVAAGGDKAVHRKSYSLRDVLAVITSSSLPRVGDLLET